jgi:hypothetical protein
LKSKLKRSSGSDAVNTISLPLMRVSSEESCSLSKLVTRNVTSSAAPFLPVIEAAEQLPEEQLA